MEKQILFSYENGNTNVVLLADGTKIRTTNPDSQSKIKFPESIDVKITDYCDMGCAYCHESSTVEGKHADLELLFNQLNLLPKCGIELAIGGGNPLSHPDLVYFLELLKRNNFVVNLTVNQGHLKTYFSLLKELLEKDLIKGLGISVTNLNFTYIEKLSKYSRNIVYHLIAGVNSVKMIDFLMPVSEECKVLVLGYKTFGFGVEYYSREVEDSIKLWKANLRNLLGKCTLSFDNLAIEQLDVKSLFTKEGWNRFYMGDDFCFTMYIDAVKQQFAPTSRSPERIDFSSMNLLEFFDTRNK
jgi:hypothetical protein